MSRSERIFCAMYLAFLSGALYGVFSLIQTGALGRAADSPLYGAVWLLLYAALVWRLAADGAYIGQSLLRHGLLLALIVAATISSVSNDLQPAPYMRLGMYVMTMLFGVWLASRRSADETLALLSKVAVWILIVHFIALPITGGATLDYQYPTVLGTPAYGGLFPHKNMAGSFFGLMAVFWFAAALSPGARVGRCLLLALAYLATVVIAGSAGPIVSAVVAALATFGALAILRARRSAPFVFGVTGVLVVALVMGWSDLLAMVGRDSNLTGRTFLWSLWPRFFFEQPLFGYGYDGFFNEDSSAYVQLWQYLPWTASSFHNSYLDLAIQLGAVGSAILVLIILKATTNTLRFARTPSAYPLAPFAIMIYIIVSSMTEMYLGLHNYITCAIVFWFYFGVQRRTSAVTVTSRTATPMVPEASALGSR